ncbi:DUF1488 domain-containing protein [Tatumella sp. TA1]|uniref:DUF1488 domain-containing protein n=1 Tax=Rosenbergiella collisarenosi TaxID=1544695 RepID=UPI0008F824B4|nr:DUF1488 domain-containing protein [Rosenbergiella collisarenosi]QGX90312.1 DUF1488 domain-containing protein [Tatumella sp. TA1]
MNQAIQFLEDEFIDESKAAIVFSVFVDGYKRICAITINTLADQFAEGEPLLVFERFRWDIEEIAEKAILSQLDDSEGYYWLSK